MTWYAMHNNEGFMGQKQNPLYFKLGVTPSSFHSPFSFEAFQEDKKTQKCI